MSKEDKSSQDLFNDTFFNPKSEGEREQVSRLQQISENPEDILKFKKKLIDAQKSLQNEPGETKQNEEEEYSDRLDHQTDRPYPPTPQRRRYDRNILKKQKDGFFKILLSIFQRMDKLAAKYIANRRVSFSVLNLLKNNSFFYPNQSVAAFVERDLIPTINHLSPWIKTIYSWGWCDKNGKKVLKPFEFNLISDFERVLNKGYLDNFLIYRHSPAKALQHLNYFLGYLYSILSDKKNVEQLKLSISKTLNQHNAQESGENAIKDSKKINNLIDYFFSLDISHDLTIPLLESYYGHAVNFFNAQDFFELEKISKSEYQADAKLKMTMFSREKAYLKKIESESKLLKKEITNLEYIQKALLFQRESPQSKMDLIDFAAQERISKLKGFNFVSDLKAHHKTFASTLFFLDSYRLFLDSPITIKQDQQDTIKLHIQFFDKEVFSNEIYTIEKSVKQLHTISMKLIPKDDLFSAFHGDQNSEKFYFLITLNHVADQYFSIAEKLHSYLNNNSEELSEEPLRSSELSKYKSIHDNTIVVEIKENSDFRSNYLFFQKTYAHVLYEIMSFCYQYTYNFENRHRAFSADSARKKTLKSQLDVRSKLEVQLQELLEDLAESKDSENGENRESDPDHSKA